LVSSAACTAGDQYFSGGEHDYAEGLPKLVPIHHDLDGVVYSIHLRTPRLLFIGADDYPLKPGTSIPYPYEPMSEDAAENRNARWEIQRYNLLKPSAEYFQTTFRKIAEFGRANGIQMIVTEWGAPNPLYGLSVDDRLEFMTDFTMAAKENGVAILYGETFEKTGLARAPHDVSRPDHRFDPAVMDLIARANDAVYDHGLDALTTEQFASLQEALRPHYDFSDVALGTKYNGASCLFELSWREGKNVALLATGELEVIDGRIRFSNAAWDKELLGDAAAFERAELAVTEDGNVVGLMEVYYLFAGSGQETLPRYVTLDGTTTSRGKGDTAPAGVTLFPIDQVLTGSLAISGCQSKPNAVSIYEGLKCSFVIDRREGADGIPSILVEGRLTVSGGQLDFVEEYWHPELRAPADTLKQASLQVTESNGLRGLMDVYFLFGDRGSEPSAPSKVRLDGSTTEVNPKPVRSTTTFMLDQVMSGSITLKTCR
jgi:hypothetical protein